MSDTNNINPADRRRQVRDIITDRRLSTDDRRKIESVLDENDDLRATIRRLEDRKGGDSNFFRILFILSCTIFLFSVLVYFTSFGYGLFTNFPYSPITREQYKLLMLLRDWSSVANFTIIASGVTGAVSWFFKEK